MHSALAGLMNNIPITGHPEHERQLLPISWGFTIQRWLKGTVDKRWQNRDTAQVLTVTQSSAQTWRTVLITWYLWEGLADLGQLWLGFWLTPAGPQGPRPRPATLWMSSAAQGRAQPYSPSVSDRHLHLHPTCELRKDVFCLLFLLQRRL